MSLNLIGVIRHSTDEQIREGRAGVERQRKDIESVQHATGARIVRTIEVIESGALVLDNRQFQQVFKDLADPSIHGVACSALDRLVRPDKFGDLSIFDHFKGNGKRIYTPSGVIDPGTQSGWVESIMRATFAGMEREAIRQRTMSGKERLRLKKRCVTGGHTLPRGVLFNKATGVWSYDLDPDDSSPRPPRHRAGDALVIPAMFDLFVNRKLSYQAIAATLGNGWSYSGVRNTLSNPIWIGIRRYDKERQGPIVRSKTLRADGEPGKYRRPGPRAQVIEQRVIENGLIPDDLFERAQEEFRNRAIIHGQRKRTPLFLLSGFLRCQCGKAWYTCSGAGRGRGGYYYRCSGRCGAPMLQRQAVDTAIIALLTGELLKLETLQQILNAIPEADPKDPGISRRTQVSAKLDQRRARLLDLYEAGDITREEFNARKRTIESERAALQHIPAPLPTVSAKELALALVETFTGFHQLPQADQRAILQRALSRIMMSGRTVVSLTLSGGFLGEMVAKLNSRSGSRDQFRTPSDVVLQFPKPYTIPSIDGRRRKAA